MTYSTKQALVEHVARSLCESAAKQIGQNPDVLWEQLRDGYEIDSRAAIRATLEWASGNVSAKMMERSLGWREYDIPDHWPDEARLPYGIFRAMLSALLQELDKGDGG